MSNPHKRFEIEIGLVGVWFTPLDKCGKPKGEEGKYYNNQELSNDVNWLTKQLQIDFNF